MTWQAYPSWLNAGDNAWQMTAATLVGLMSVPGLAGVHRIIELHQGSIEVQSKIGVGTEFTIRLPLDVAAAMRREGMRRTRDAGGSRA